MGKLAGITAFIAVVVLSALHTGSTVVKADAPRQFGYGGGTPTLGSVRWDCRGGEPAAGEPNGGGKGGGLYVSALNGAVLHNDGRSRPSNVLGTNAFAAALADNKVTYTEISAMSGFDGNNLILSTGVGVYLPSNATLDLSDTPDFFSMNIEAQDDVVVIAGTIKTGRTGNDSAYLTLRTNCPVSVSSVGVVFTGSINADGSAGWSSTGVQLSAAGDVIALGTCSARGGKGNHSINGGGPGFGGAFSFISDEGDVILGSGSVDASGGEGGEGGSLYVQAESTGNDIFDWGLRADAGGFDAEEAYGSAAGYLYAEFSVAVEFRIRVIARGFPGGSGGVVCHGAASGHLYVTADGGMLGAKGGGAWVRVSDANHVTLSGTARGADFNTPADGGASGGEGGNVGLESNSIHDCLIDFNCDAGDGIDYSRGKGSLFVGADLVDGTSLSIDGLKIIFRARTGSGANGGPGGAASLGGRTPMEGSGFDVDIDVSGTDRSGGPDGELSIELSSSMPGATIDGNFSLRASNLGKIAVFFDNCPGTFAGNYSIDVSGTSSTHGAGSGGSVWVNQNPRWPFPHAGTFAGSLSIKAQGSNGTGASQESGGAGGGGNCYLSCGIGGEFHCTSFHLQAQGGDSQFFSGGSGGNLSGTFLGDFRLDSGSINLAGGDGLSNNTVHGGPGGTISLATNGHLIDLGVSIDAHGGSSKEGGTGGTLEINLNSDNTATSGSLTLRGGANLQAGNSAETGAAGGTLIVSDGSASSGGPVNLLGAFDLNGGDSSHWANHAGFGGLVTLDVAGAITISGSIFANGGNDNKTGGYGGPAFRPLNFGNNRAASLHLTSTAVIQANGGKGYISSFDGRGGPILLDPAGIGPTNPNLVEDGGSSVTATGNPSGTITRD